MWKQSGVLSTTLALVVGSSVTSGAGLIYEVDRIVAPGSITGTIETDGRWACLLQRISSTGTSHWMQMETPPPSADSLAPIRYCDSKD